MNKFVNLLYIAGLALTLVLGSSDSFSLESKRTYIIPSEATPRGKPQISSKPKPLKPVVKEVTDKPVKIPFAKTSPNKVKKSIYSSPIPILKKRNFAEKPEPKIEPKTKLKIEPKVEPKPKPKAEEKPKIEAKPKIVAKPKTIIKVTKKPIKKIVAKTVVASKVSSKQPSTKITASGVCHQIPMAR